MSTNLTLPLLRDSSVPSLVQHAKVLQDDIILIAAKLQQETLKAETLSSEESMNFYWLCFGAVSFVLGILGGVENIYSAASTGIGLACLIREVYKGLRGRKRVRLGGKAVAEIRAMLRNYQIELDMVKEMVFLKVMGTPYDELPNY